MKMSWLAGLCGLPRTASEMEVKAALEARLGRANSREQQERTGTVLDAVNQKMDREHLTYADAWEAIKRERADCSPRWSRRRSRSSPPKEICQPRFHPSWRGRHRTYEQECF